MGAGYLADSNAIIDLFLGRLPFASATWLDQRIGQKAISLSVITRIELLTKTQPDAEYVLTQALINSVTLLPLDEPVIQQTILLRQ
jgi:predicted nucleic acid-binding protein